jgi:hypothetical protein
MADMLEIDDASLGPRLVPFWEERSRAESLFATPLAQSISDSAIGRALAAGLPDAPDAARARLEAAERVREGRRAAELRLRALRRLPIFALIAALLLAGAWAAGGYSVCAVSR